MADEINTGCPRTSAAAEIDAGGRGATPDVSVIVAVHNGGESFGLCLRSLQQAMRPGVEVIVVDDGSTDDSLEQAEKAGFRTIHQDRRGPAAGRNRAARTARGEILLFVDSDVVVPPDIVPRVLAVFEADPGLSAVIGSYDDQPAAPNFLSQYRNLLHHYVHQHSSQRAQTFWGACGAIRKKAFVAVGGMDESYDKPSVEDIELGYALSRAGYRIALCKDIQVKHLKVWRAWMTIRTDLLGRAAPWTELLLRYRMPANDLNLRWSSRLSVLLAFVLVAAVLLCPWRPWLELVAAGSATVLLTLNVGPYAFFYRKGGLAFAAGAAAWHLVYFLCCGLGAALGVLRHLIRPRPPRGRSAAPTDGNATDVVSAYWDGVALRWLEQLNHRLWRAHCDELHRGLLRGWLTGLAGTSVLKTDLFEEAIGPGVYASLTAAGATFTGIDISPAICRAAGRNHPGLQAAAADVRCMPFDDGAFDVVVSTSTLDHFASRRDIDRALGEIARVLRPGGRLILTMDNPGNPVVRLRNALPIRWLNRLGLVPYCVGRALGRRQLAASLRGVGLTVERSTAIGHCPRMPAVLLASVLERASGPIRRRFLEALGRVERLSALPTRWLTGYFVAMEAVKPCVEGGGE